MKKILLIIFVTLTFNSSIFAADELIANLIEIKTYKGDSGKNIRCDSDRILVQEVFGFPNISLKGIVIAHSTKEGQLFLEQRNWKIKGTNHIEYSYCASQGHKADIQVRFMNSKGKTSNLLGFTVNTDSIKLLEARLFPKLVSIQ